MSRLSRRTVYSALLALTLWVSANITYERWRNQLLATLRPIVVETVDHEKSVFTWEKSDIWYHPPRYIRVLAWGVIFTTSFSVISLLTDLRRKKLAE